MRLKVRIALVFACAAVLCAAQTAPATPPPAAPAASESSAPPAPAATETKEPAKAEPSPETASAKAPSPTAPANPSLELPPVKKSSASAPAAPKTGATDEKPYVIGPLDVLYVRVWNNQNLTGMVDVRPDGMISMALIGDVKADGLTVPQLVDELRMKLADYLNSPEVDVQVTKINSKRFFILGEVGRPGEYPLVSRTTILEALSNAGGFRDTANQKKIYLLRGSVKHPFNYKDVIEGKHLEQDIPIENGDKLVVPQ